jgi:hypothetical protein
LFSALFGFFAAPPLLKSILQKQLSAELHRQVSIDGIAINPYALSARISGLSVKGDEGKEVAGFDELFVNVSVGLHFQAGSRVDEIRLQGRDWRSARVAEGRYDISDLLDEWMKPKDEPEKETPRFSLNNIQLVNGKIVFDDQPKGKVHTISDINPALPFVSSLPYHADISSSRRFRPAYQRFAAGPDGDSKPFLGDS